MNPYIVQISNVSGWVWGRGKYIEGPSDAKTVKRLGYSFTDDSKKAWPFPTWNRGNAKAKIVACHMSMSRDEFVVAKRDL
jgi:hypothetical protein